MCTQFFQRRRHSPAPRTTGQLLRQNLDRAVHANGEYIFDIGQVCIGAVVLDVGAKAANRGLHRGSIVGMLAHKAR